MYIFLVKLVLTGSLKDQAQSTEYEAFESVPDR